MKTKKFISDRFSESNEKVKEHFDLVKINAQKKLCARTNKKIENFFRFDKIKEESEKNKCKKQQEEEERKQTEKLQLIFEKCANLLLTLCFPMFWTPKISQ